MKLKIVYRIGTDIFELILDPDTPVVFYREFCCFTDIDGFIHTVRTEHLTGISVVGGSNGWRMLDGIEDSLLWEGSS